MAYETSFRESKLPCVIQVTNITYNVDGKHIVDKDAIEELGLLNEVYDSFIENALEKLDGDLFYFPSKIEDYINSYSDGPTVNSFQIHINDDTYLYTGKDIEELKGISTYD